MPHHTEGDMGNPFDPQDTDWGKDVAHRLGLHETQIRELDMHVYALRQDHAMLKQDLQTNTDQTNAIKGDTEWLVNVFKGSKAIAPTLVFLLAFIGAIGGFLAWILSHWKN